MGLALLAWSWMRSSKRKPQENEPLVSMVLPSFGIWGVRAVSSEMALQVSPFLVLSSLFWSFSFILFGCDLCFLGYQWIYLGRIPVLLQACSSVKGRFPLLAVIRQQLLLLRNVCHKSVISCHSPSSWYQALWLHSPVGNSSQFSFKRPLWSGLWRWERTPNRL